MNIDVGRQVLSDIIVHSKYAKYLPNENRRETWREIVERNKQMHIDKFRGSLDPDSWNELRDMINSSYEYIFDRKALPSMRSAQFAGRSVEMNPARIYNCAYAPVDHIDFFSELMFLLLGGTGVGYSVQTHHVDKLPPLRKPIRERRYLIGDSIEGWADAVRILMKAYFDGGYLPRFDFSDIRPKGSRLVTSGGKAPGPMPLKVCLEKIQNLLDSKEDGSKLKSIEAHDICCFIADAVLAGGIRRAALISLFSIDDWEMMGCKGEYHAELEAEIYQMNGTHSIRVRVDGKEQIISVGDYELEQIKEGNPLPWYHFFPHRGRANNSVVIHRTRITEDKFKEIWNYISTHRSGEPGIFFTNDIEYGTNPCAEISLRPYQFCNLVTIDASTVESQEDLNRRVEAATVIATLQASYTDFHYLRDVWKDNTEKDALIGVSQTGIAAGNVENFNLEEAAQVVKNVNAYVARLIGINRSARCTTLKPEGSGSLVLWATSSGVGAFHDYFYIRRMRVNKNEPIYLYIKETQPQLVEDEKFGQGAVISIPIKAPDTAITRNDETTFDFLERIKRYNLEWVRAGHNEGPNYNNVSCTVNVKDDEWGGVGDWMWTNRYSYNAISVLPYDGGNYVQAPFETITEDQYKEMIQTIHAINVLDIKEEEDNTSHHSEVACGPDGCEVTFV